MTAEDLEKIRKQIGWTKREMAKRIGIGERTIHAYIREQRDIPEPIAKLITAYMEGYRPKEE